jgi:hypothetical protein
MVYECVISVNDERISSEMHLFAWDVGRGVYMVIRLAWVLVFVCLVSNWVSFHHLVSWYSWLWMIYPVEQ